MRSASYLMLLAPCQDERGVAPKEPSAFPRREPSALHFSFSIFIILSHF